MSARRVIVVCNALDDATRLERRITTDSPAASRKVFHMCRALRKNGVRTYVLSLGRGEAGGSSAWFRSRVRRVDGVAVVYAPFSDMPILSELVSLLAPVGIAVRLRGPTPRAMVFYNRERAYLATLLASVLLGFKRILDLEDGEFGSDGQARSGWTTRTVRKLYDRGCSTGALIACSALSAMTAIRPVQCYYGTAEPAPSPARWSDGELIRTMLGGTLAPATGVDLLIEAVHRLRRDQPDWAHRLHIEITGKGPSLPALKALARSTLSPMLTVHGRTNDLEYRQIVERCEIGLALKPCGGHLASSTFPSKVVEMASAGMLVISTDISDVRQVLGDGALYLKTDRSDELIAQLRRVVTAPEQARQIAETGMRAMWARFASDKAGQDLSNFIFRTRL